MGAIKWTCGRRDRSHLVTGGHSLLVTLVVWYFFYHALAINGFFWGMEKEKKKKMMKDNLFTSLLSPQIKRQLSLLSRFRSNHSTEIHSCCRCSDQHQHILWEYARGAHDLWFVGVQRQRQCYQLIKVANSVGLTEEIPIHRSWLFLQMVSWLQMHWFNILNSYITSVHNQSIFSQVYFFFSWSKRLFTENIQR